VPDERADLSQPSAEESGGRLEAAYGKNHALLVEINGKDRRTCFRLNKNIPPQLPNRDENAAAMEIRRARSSGAFAPARSDEQFDGLGVIGLPFCCRRLHCSAN